MLKRFKLSWSAYRTLGRQGAKWSGRNGRIGITDHEAEAESLTFGSTQTPILSLVGIINWEGQFPSPGCGDSCVDLYETPKRHRNATARNSFFYSPVHSFIKTHLPNVSGRPQLCIFIDINKKECKLARAPLYQPFSNLPADTSAYDLALIYDYANVCDEGTKGVIHSLFFDKIHQLIPYMQICPNTILRVLSRQSATSYTVLPSISVYSSYCRCDSAQRIMARNVQYCVQEMAHPNLRVTRDECHELRAFVLSSFWSPSPRSIPLFLTKGQVHSWNFPPKSLRTTSSLSLLGTTLRLGPRTFTHHTFGIPIIIACRPLG